MLGSRLYLGGLILLTLTGTVRSQQTTGSATPVDTASANQSDVPPPASDDAYINSEAPPDSNENLLFPSASSSRGGAFEAGASFYLLKPHFQNNTAYTVSTGSTVVNGSNTSTTGLASTTSFDWNYKPAAAFWLGYRDESGLGIRAGYFFFDQSSGTASISETGAQAAAGQIISPSPFTPTNFPNIGAPIAGRFNFGSPGFLLTGPGVPPTPVGQDNLAFSSSLRINAVDVEATYTIQSGNWSFLGGAGGRYLRLSQRYNGVLTNAGGGTGDSEIQTLNFYHQFTGGGPTISGLVSWTLPQTNLALFGRGRGSLLVGSTNQNVAFTQTVNDPAGLTGAPGSFSFASAIPSTSDSVMPVTELELGLQYSWCLWNSTWTGRASVIDQTYFGAGNASNTYGNLSLFGCQLGLAVSY